MPPDRDERIERMYREKQERIARQIALREARETVALWAAAPLKDPSVVAAKVIEIADEYLKWLKKE
ncbi:hypothetical protein [Geoglobus acetivorans]|uniref:Uncharacterized protein n=1 Tax=Geoglobus acetivorans TaxID=565033 RepID=A0ABZ3H239_GEOAI|nr:hypothetical protein [Geoglobus acetivorans]